MAQSEPTLLLVVQTDSELAGGTDGRSSRNSSGARPLQSGLR
jgi:hypothetical protein